MRDRGECVDRLVVVRKMCFNKSSARDVARKLPCSQGFRSGGYGPGDVAMVVVSVVDKLGAEDRNVARRESIDPGCTPDRGVAGVS